jgi:hypothetical protein
MEAKPLLLSVRVDVPNPVYGDGPFTVQVPTDYRSFQEIKE